MPIVGKYFPSQKSQEKVFLLLRRHWFTYSGFILIAVVTGVPIVALIVTSINNPQIYDSSLGNLLLLALFAYLLVAVGVMLYGFIDYYLDVYIVTNERIVAIAQNGFFRRDISELHLHQIQDVSAKVYGLFPTVMHYGDIHIQTAAERENFVFKSIPNPYRVSKLIADLHEAQLEEGEKEQLAEQKVISQYRKDIKGESKDEVSLEDFDPKSLSIARRRTKDFLHGGRLEQTDLKTKVQEELSNKKYDKLLEEIQAAKETGFERDDGKSTHKVAESEGEMKEDQEIDL